MGRERTIGALLALALALAGCRAPGETARFPTRFDTVWAASVAVLPGAPAAVQHGAGRLSTGWYEPSETRYVYIPAFRERHRFDLFVEPVGGAWQVRVVAHVERADGALSPPSWQPVEAAEPSRSLAQGVLDRVATEVARRADPPRRRGPGSSTEPYLPSVTISP